MKQIKLNRSLVSFITGGLLLAASPVSHADTILNIEQTTWGNGAVIYAKGWGSQSFTVPAGGSELLTSIGFKWNGGVDIDYWTHGETATVELYTGAVTDGSILGTKLTTVMGHVAQVTGAKSWDDHFFVADFGGWSLTPGQYTVKIKGSDYYNIDLVGSAYNGADQYAGGSWYDSSSGPYAMGDATFFTPSPTGYVLTPPVVPDVASVPEPSAFALLAIGGLVLGGYAWRKKQQPADRSGSV